MGSSQSAPVQVVNTIEQFGYYPATVFKFFVVIGIIVPLLYTTAICVLSPITSYPNQPGSVHNGNNVMVSQPCSVAHPHPQRKLGNKLCGRQDANFAANLPAAAANTLRHPCHLLTMLGLFSENDPSKPPPDTSICVRSSFKKIRLRVRPPCCQLGQTQK